MATFIAVFIAVLGVSFDIICIVILIMRLRGKRFPTWLWPLTKLNRFIPPKREKLEQLIYVK